MGPAGRQSDLGRRCLQDEVHTFKGVARNGRFDVLSGNAITAVQTREWSRVLCASIGLRGGHHSGTRRNSSAHGPLMEGPERGPGTLPVSLGSRRSPREVETAQWVVPNIVSGPEAARGSTA